MRFKVSMMNDQANGQDATVIANNEYEAIKNMKRLNPNSKVYKSNGSRNNIKS